VLPAWTIEACKDGPRVAVCANLHGDECTGTGIIHRLRPVLAQQLRQGSVRLYPSLNPQGLRSRQRGVPEDDNDPNRVFPGDKRGSAAERMAWALWHDILSFKPDLVIDLHSDGTANIPYALLDRPVRHVASRRRWHMRRLLRLGRASGLTVVQEYAERAYRRFHLDRSLTGALLNHGDIPALTLEIGVRGMLEPRAVDDGLRAVLGLLTACEAMDRPASAHPSRVGGGSWRREAGPVAGCEGVLCLQQPPGVLLEPSQALARIHDISGIPLETLSMPTSCIVLSQCEQAWVRRGTVSATVAVPDD